MVHLVRILILSDIHGNSDALETIINHTSHWDYLFVLGDLVDYGPEPHKVIEIVKELKPDAIVTGNHDFAVAFNTDCHCAQEIHDLSEYTRLNISYKLLDKNYISWLSTLPKTLTKEIDNIKFYIVHGSPRNPLYGYMKPNLSDDELFLALTPSLYAIKPKPVDSDIVIAGHTHIPMSKHITRVLIINPGSVGQPRDGDNRASYAIYDTNKKNLEIHRIVYDIDNVVKKLISLELDKHYLNRIIQILKTGRV